MDEEARLEALRKYRILDTAPEPQFDRVAEIARRQFDMPVALVAFMDSDRNFLKAHGDLPFDESTALIREADNALYEAKRAGRNRSRVSDDSMAAAAVRRRLIEHDLPEAMASGAIMVHFQPVVRASTREMIGVEALARWRHPLLGHISPIEFVGIAEEIGQVRATAGCGTFQGYRFGRPMPASDLDTRYRRQTEPTASIRLVAG